MRRAWAALVVVAFAAGGVHAQDGAGSSAVATAPAACELINTNAGNANGPEALLARCGQSVVRVGDALSHTSAWNVAQSSLLIVRQERGWTAISLVSIGADGVARAADVTTAIRYALKTAGLPQPMLLSVDLSSFVSAASVEVLPAPDGGGASKAAALTIDLTPLIAATANQVTTTQS